MFLFILKSMFRLFAIVMVTAVAHAQHDRPNVLLIMTDDQGYGDYGFTGNPVLKTPHIDELARQGVRFTEFYVAPVCAPTRASLLTGRYHQRTGVRSVTNGYETMATDEITLAEYLREAGYRTGLFGKWHLGENYPHVPHAQGFDTYVGFRTGHFSNYFNPTLEKNGAPLPLRGYITDALTDQAIAFMRTADRQPFFCYVPYNAPHTPLDVPAEYWKPYHDAGIPEAAARVYGMVANIDDNVGRLMAALKAMGKLENTLVIYLSDNGPIFPRTKGVPEPRYNAGLRDMKFSVYEGGIKTPCLFYWKETFTPHEVTQPAAHIDVVPTVLALAGVPVSRRYPIDGSNLMPLLRDGNAPWDDRLLFLNYSLRTLREPAPYPGGMARNRRYKMVDGTMLYDLQEDPGELHDLAAEKKEILVSLDSAYRRWWSKVHQRGFERQPLAVGHPEEAEAMLTPHTGRATGALKFMGLRGNADNPVIGTHPSGVDGDWLSNWTTPQDEVCWNIRAARSAQYQLKVVYRNAGKSAAPLKWRISIDQRAFVGEAMGGVPDEWTEATIGSLRLRRGDYTLRLSADGVGDAQAEVKAVIVGLQ